MTATDIHAGMYTLRVRSWADAVALADANRGAFHSTDDGFIVVWPPKLKLKGKPMFNITTYHDDQYHPLHGNTYAAADVAAVLADLADVHADDVADEYGGELGDIVADLPRGCRLLLPGDMRNIQIERIA